MLNDMIKSTKDKEEGITQEQNTELLRGQKRSATYVALTQKLEDPRNYK